MIKYFCIFFLFLFTSCYIDSYRNIDEKVLYYQHLDSIKKSNTIIKQNLHKVKNNNSKKIKYYIILRENYKILKNKDSLLYYNKLIENTIIQISNNERKIYYKLIYTYSSLLMLLIFIIFLVITLLIYKIKNNKLLKKINLEKDMLLAVLSHDLKTGIRNINTGISFIEKNKNVEIHIESIKKNSAQLYNLINDLVTWYKTKISKTISNNFDLNNLLNTFQSDRVQIINEIDSIKSSKEILEIVLRNLVSNALKFSTDIVTIKTELKNNKIIISVTDKGVGMNKEQLIKFKNNTISSTNGINNEKGHGIGLLICKDYLKQLKSQLTVESELEKGTKFSFIINK